jgi:hypothetical protein
MRISICSRRVDEGYRRIESVADLLAVLGFVAFAVVMLALIWALDKV